ncbi:Suppression of tumorigenicity 5 protein [Amphibalanus amphitrite]|uniref:Suppression of tumorigenicity 5 protein n=1 Tax=Amphibalanus amphitrite TaxID=1232801 RepID=A0A6A4WQI1_AMPAM|nr:Suppression of tumorigenicity 5 protein [Amphibalanus amphitrite]
MSVQEMMKRFEETRVSDSAAPAGPRPRGQVARRTASFRTTAPLQPRLRHRNSEGRIGLTRSRPVSAHVSPLLRERPAVLKRNAALKARVSDRVRDMERRPSAERAAESKDSPSPPLPVKAGQTNGEVTGSRPAHRPLTRVTAADPAPRPVTAPPVNHVSVVNHTPAVRAPVKSAQDPDNNNGPMKPGRLNRRTVIPTAATQGLTEDFSSLPLPTGPPPRKPPRTFAHDVYVQARQSSAAGAETAAGGAGAAVVPAAATTVTIRRSSSGPRPAIARKPSDLGRRRSGRLETFQPLPAPADPPASARDSPSPAEHVYAEPTVPRRELPPPPPSPPPPPPPGRNRRPVRQGPVEPYAVSSPLRRTASDETLYGTLSREHVYERLPNAKTRPVSASSSAGSPPGLRRHHAFKRHERPSLRQPPARPPPPALARVQRQIRIAGRDDGPPPSPRIGDDDPSPRAPLPRIGDDDPSPRTLSPRIGDDDPSPRAPSPRIGDDDPSPRAGDGGGPAGDGGGPPSPRAGDDARPLDSGPPPSLVGGSPSPAPVGDGRPPPPPRAGDGGGPAGDGGGPPSPRAGDGGPPPPPAGDGQPPTSLRLAGGDPLEGSVERAEGRMGCLLTAVSADGDPADPEQRSERWKAGPLALRRKNYLRRVSTQMGGSRPRLSVSPPERLFDALLVVALSADAEGRLEPCVVSRYPPDVSLEADVAPFCFPDAARWQRAPDVWGRSAADGGAAYTLVVTDQHGGRSYGFCRRLTAHTGQEDAVTLPIAYCLLTRHDAPAFYSKLLAALLEHHGTSEQHRLSVLDELYGRPFPLPGGSVSVPPVPATCPGDETETITNGTHTEAKPKQVRRPLDPRLEEDGLFLLVRRLGVDLVLSAAVSALQSALCPFVWQHCLIPVVPCGLAELLAVPSPFIMGALPETRPLDHLNGQEDVICVDLDEPSLVQSVGDEATILPRRLSRTLAEALKLAACLPGGDPAPGVASVMLAETLLRLFVEVCGHYRGHLTTQQDGRPVLQTCPVSRPPVAVMLLASLCVIRSWRRRQSDDVREFLEWFTETAMFAAFIESCEQQPESPAVSLFDRRVMEQHGYEEPGCHGLLRGTKQLGKALGGRFKFRLPS